MLCLMVRTLPLMVRTLPLMVRTLPLLVKTLPSMVKTLPLNIHRWGVVTHFHPKMYVHPDSTTSALLLSNLPEIPGGRVEEGTASPQNPSNINAPDNSNGSVA